MQKLPLARGGIDAASQDRANVDLAALAAAAPVIAVDMRRRVLLRQEDKPALAALTPSEIRREFSSLTPAIAQGRIFFLGKVEGKPVLGCHVSDLDSFRGRRISSIRQVGALLSPADSSLASAAIALAVWHSGAAYCPVCGANTVAQAGGWERKCSGCGKISYPRTDPSIICSVIDEQDRLLIAHNIAWQEGRISVLAGYVEAGEAAEETVHREIAEEVGLSVCNVQYLYSQAWPYPRSLMLAFTATTAATDADIVCQEDEIGWAKFVTREEFISLAKKQQIIVPSDTTIAASMIERWLGQPLPRPEGEGASLICQ